MREPTLTKAQARQRRIQNQIKKLLVNYNPDRVFSAHDMASAMREVWSRVPNQREIAHTLIRLGELRVVVRARDYERQGIEGNTNMWRVNSVWLAATNARF